MDTEYTGPVEVGATAEFPKSGLWDVHGPFKTEALYANGVRMSVSGDYPNGIKFYGSKGWIFVSRGNEQVTKSDPVAKLNDATGAGRQRSRRSSNPSSAPTRFTCTKARNSTATGWTASSAASSPYRPRRWAIAPAPRA